MKLLVQFCMLLSITTLLSSCGQKGPLRDPGTPEQYKHIKF